MIISCCKCILDSNDDSFIVFDEKGVCNYCNSYTEIEKKHQIFLMHREEELAKMLNLIKYSKKGKYDCVIGLSGGTDSSYLVYLCKQWGLNPLIVHLDNGWNSELSVKNIKSILSNVGFDLYTFVIDWNEFKDIQRSFIKASVVDIELITDHAISALLLKVAAENNIRYILSGESTFTEGLLPQSWVHSKIDLINIKDIQRKFGSKKIKSLPTAGFFKRLYYSKIKGIKIFKPLDYIDYNKEVAKTLLKDKLGWQDYGGKHNESIFTKFYQSYILPKKFAIDKRKAHASSLIRAGQLTREEALQVVEDEQVGDVELSRDKQFVLKKLGFSEEEFEFLMNQPRVEHTFYKSIMNYYRFASKVKRLIIKRK